MAFIEYGKRDLINWMNPSADKVLIDVACGTGDLGKLFLDLTNKNGKIFCVDPNKGMLSKGKTVNCTEYKNINWVNSPSRKVAY